MVNAIICSAYDPKWQISISGSKNLMKSDSSMWETFNAHILTLIKMAAYSYTSPKLQQNTLSIISRVNSLQTSRNSCKQVFFDLLHLTLSIGSSSGK